MNKPNLQRAPIATALLLALAPMAAVAQQTATQSNDDGIETIEVTGHYTVTERIDTATGLGLTLQETPQSVSVLTEERIRDQALDTVVDVVQNATGVSFRAVDNVRNTLQSRGFDITTYQIDGVPLPWSLAADSGETIADVIMYERVEFVRGSTGLLTGVGDPSGSINLVRKHADATELTGYVSAAYGRWNNAEVSADVAGSLGMDGAIRGRLVAKYEQGDSFQDLFSNESTVLYGVLEGDISNNTLLRVGYSVQHNVPKGNHWGGLPGTYSDGSQTDWDTSVTTAADWTRWETTNSNLFANLQHHFSNGWLVKVNYNRMDYNKDDVRLLYVYGALDKDTGAGLYTWPYRAEGDSVLDSVDIQLQGDYPLWGQTHEFVVGSLHSEQSAVASTYSVVSSDSVVIDNFFEWNSQWAEPVWTDSPDTVAQDMDTKQTGYYAATRLHVNDELKLIAGARLADWERTGQSYGTATEFGDDGVVIPYAGVLYDITDEHRFYASYTDIFMPQNAMDRNGRYLDPLTGATVELGLKSRFLDERLNTAVSVFSIQQDNLAQNDIDADGTVHYVPDAPAGTIAQRGAKGTESKGFEIEVVGQPVDGWHINAGWSVFEAEDASGADVNTSYPRRQFKLFSTYNLESVLPALTIGGGVNWMSEAHDGGAVQDAVALVNVMARYDVSEQIDVQFNINNLLDEKYYNYIAGNGQIRFGQPRFAQVRVSYSF
ncbi:TonB-dependent siderophore receptor [Aestuariibacter sp. GS-14]|uniref:TonB-dependent siderophore receptor n=1 Tax=Aestuariibacter sp. GS-14 TaxID=2590670 RepID=UPI0015E82D78|nr:TonB-dependent siderophore receptor [Aestuariibacter sp. GS-14]